MDTSCSASPRNVWNDRAADHVRSFCPNRPWYHFSLQLLRQCGVQGRVLDVGCGLGEFLELLKRSGYTATGCDGNISQIKYVQSLGFKARLADLERELPFEANSFEVISCLEVIEHISRAEALLAEMGRVLVPGGHLVLTTPNYLFWRERVGHLMGQPPTGEGIHLRFFTPRTLTAAMKKAGFELVARASYGPCTGLNFFRRLFSLEDVHIILPALWENCLAYNLAYLCRRLR